MAVESRTDFDAKNPQMPEDQPQILAGTAQDHIDGVTLGTFEIVALQKPIVFHVPDNRFDGIAAF